MTFNSQSAVQVEMSARTFLPGLQVFNRRIVHRAGICLLWTIVKSSYPACCPTANEPESNFSWDVKHEKEKELVAWDKFQGSKHISTQLHISETEEVQANTTHIKRWAIHLSCVSARTNSFINILCHPPFTNLQVWREIRMFHLVRMQPNFKKLMML